MMKPITGVLVFGLVFAAAPSHAQLADGQPAALKGAPHVIVTDRAGQETIGRLVSWTGSSMVIRADGADRTYAPGEAVRLDLRRDSLKNGAIIGAGVGLFFGAMAGGFSDCPGARGSGPCAGARIAGGLGVAAVYAAIGTAIDALIPGRTLLWRAGK